MICTFIEFRSEETPFRQQRKVTEIIFFNGDTELANYHAIDSHLYIDQQDKFVHFTDGKKYKFQSTVKNSTKEAYKVAINRKTFLRILCYCFALMEFDVSLNDNDELELVIDIIKIVGK